MSREENWEQGGFGAAFGVCVRIGGLEVGIHGC